MEFNNNVEFMLFVLWGINLLIPLIVGGFDLWWSYSIRSDFKNYGGRLQVFKWSKVSPAKSGDLTDFTLSWIIYDAVIVGVYLFLVSLIDITLVQFLYSLLVSGVIVITMFAPRFIIDIIKRLKYNKNNGKLDEIEFLKEQIKELQDYRDSGKYP